MKLHPQILNSIRETAGDPPREFDYGWAFCTQVSPTMVQQIGPNSGCRDFMGTCVVINAKRGGLDKERTRLIYRSTSFNTEKIFSRLVKLHRIEDAYGISRTNVTEIDRKTLYIDGDPVYQTSSQLITLWTSIMRALFSAEKLPARGGLFDWILKIKDDNHDAGMLESTLTTKINGKAMIEYFFEQRDVFNIRNAIEVDHPSNYLRTKDKIGGSGGFYTFTDAVRALFQANAAYEPDWAYIGVLNAFAKENKLDKSKMRVRTHVFVYGTLMRGESNNGVMQKAGGTVVGGYDLSLRAKMLSLGGYPGLVLNDKLPVTTIYGELWRINDIAPLDALEGYPSFYGRDIIQVGDGHACVYTLPESYLSADRYKVIEGGNWRRHNNPEQKNFPYMLKQKYPDIFEKLERERKRQGRTSDYKDIDRALEWSVTTQGHSYWYNLHESFRDSGFYKSIPEPY